MALAFAAFHCSAAGAVALAPISIDGDGSFAQESAASPMPFEALDFVLAGLRGLEDADEPEKPATLGLDPDDPRAAFLARLTRLAALNPYTNMNEPFVVDSGMWLREPAAAGSPPVLWPVARGAVVHFAGAREVLWEPVQLVAGGGAAVHAPPPPVLGLTEGYPLEKPDIGVKLRLIGVLIGLTLGQLAIAYLVGRTAR